MGKVRNHRSRSEHVRALISGSIRELAFEGFKEAMQDAQIATMDIGASVICSAPSTTNSDHRQVCSPSISVSTRNPHFM